MEPITTFTAAKVGSADYICLAGVMDLLPASDRYTRVITFDRMGLHPWGFDEEWDFVSSIAVWRDPEQGHRLFVTLTQTGWVDFQEDEAHQREWIPGSGLSENSSAGWGHMSALHQIGDHLYACGGAGQVYKREGPNQWVHMDEGLLQPPGVCDRILPRAIKGPHEQAIYVVGATAAEGLPPFAAFWNGQLWRHLSLPKVAERLTDIFAESESRIWLCGANGTLLLGNAKDGFRSLSTVNDNQLFSSVHLFGGKAYLASNLGLFVYDPATPAFGIREVVTGLVPELQDANVVDSADGVLWSIGPKDIARFDGVRWERIHHPDNVRIGA